MMTAHPSFYLLGHSDAEYARLTKQTELIAHEAGDLLGRLGIPHGARACDIGCGPRGILDQLSTCVGKQGCVIGVENNPRFAEEARRFAAERGLANVRIVEADARATGLPHASFDVVIARLVLVNVQQPQTIVHEMVSLARPGGVVVSYEADYQTHTCDPPSLAWDRLLAAYASYAHAHGVDLYVGRKTGRFLREAGLGDIRVKPIVHAYPIGHPRRSVLLDFVLNAKDALVRERFVSRSDFSNWVDALRGDLADERRLVISHVFYEVSGRKAN